MDKKMNQDPADALRQVAEKLKGTKREFGSFVAYIDDDLCLKIGSEIGWSIAYPFGTTTWAVLCAWFETWDDISKSSVDNFIKGLVFPTSVRLIDIDDVYINDIISAHERLSERVAVALDGVPEEGDKTIGEAILDVFGAVDDYNEGDDTDE